MYRAVGVHTTYKIRSGTSSSHHPIIPHPDDIIHHRDGNDLDDNHADDDDDQRGKLVVSPLRPEQQELNGQISQIDVMSRDFSGKMPSPCRSAVSM